MKDENILHQTPLRVRGLILERTDPKFLMVVSFSLRFFLRSRRIDYREEAFGSAKTDWPFRRLGSWGHSIGPGVRLERGRTLEWTTDGDELEESSCQLLVYVPGLVCTLPLLHLTVTRVLEGRERPAVDVEEGDLSVVSHTPSPKTPSRGHPTLVTSIHSNRKVGWRGKGLIYVRGFITRGFWWTEVGPWSTSVERYVTFLRS